MRAEEPVLEPPRRVSAHEERVVASPVRTEPAEDPVVELRLVRVMARDAFVVPARRALRYDDLELADRRVSLYPLSRHVQGAQRRPDEPEIAMAIEEIALPAVVEAAAQHRADVPVV